MADEDNGGVSRSEICFWKMEEIRWEMNELYRKYLDKNEELIQQGMELKRILAEESK